MRARKAWGRMVAAQMYRTAAPGYARRGHRRSGGRASGLGAGAVQPHRARQLLQARAVLQAGLVLGVGRFLLRQARGLCALGLQLCHALAYLRHGGQSGFFAFHDGIGALAEIGRAHVQHLGADDDIGPRQLSLPDILDDLERQLILKAFEKAKGVKTETARLLGIKTSALYYKLEKYGIQ